MSKAMDALDRLADTIGGCTCSMCTQNREDTALLRDYITTTEAEREARSIDAYRLAYQIWASEEDSKTSGVALIMADRHAQRQLGRDDSAERFKELEEELSHEWISTKDRLPEDGQIVAFVIDPSIDYYGGSVCAGHFRIEKYGDRAHPGFNTWGLGGFSASHWMPLPIAPQPALSGARKVEP